jgi:hypothetical protein
MNERLLALYDAALPSLEAVRASNAGVSWPLFVEVPPGYESAPIKLLVVGQQTNGWGEGQLTSPADVVALYRAFDLGRHYRRAPFLRAAHQLYCLLCPSGPERAFVWSNLVKVCQHRVRPLPAVEEMVCRLRLLPEEVAIVRPDAAVFFTGSGYDGRLRETFPAVVFHRVSKLISRLEHAQLPWHSYRTAHPKYLRLSGNWAVLEELSQLVRGRG